MKGLCYIAILASILGCGRSTEWDRYMPSEPLARQALEAALSAWKNGQPPGVLPGRSPAVQVVDSMRRAGQVLADYQNLGEVAIDGRRGFLVQLRLENPPETRKIRFCVLGIDPLWVFREEELDMMDHWACGAGDEDKTKERAKDETKEPQNHQHAERDKDEPRSVAKPQKEAKP